MHFFLGLSLPPAVVVVNPFYADHFFFSPTCSIPPPSLSPFAAVRPAGKTRDSSFFRKHPPQTMPINWWRVAALISAVNGGKGEIPSLPLNETVPPPAFQSSTVSKWRKKKTNPSRSHHQWGKEWGARERGGHVSQPLLSLL